MRARGKTLLSSKTRIAVAHGADTDKLADSLFSATRIGNDGSRDIKLEVAGSTPARPTKMTDRVV